MHAFPFSPCLQVDFSLRAQRSDEAARAAEADLSALRQRMAQAAHTSQARVREGEALRKALEKLRGEEYEVEARQLQVGLYLWDGAVSSGACAVFQNCCGRSRGWVICEARLTLKILFLPKQPIGS